MKIKLSKTQQYLKSLWDYIKTHRLQTLGIALAWWLTLEIGFLPWGELYTFKKNNPSETALMRQREREAKSAKKQFRKSQQWISLSSIPKDLQNAVIVAEDGTFYGHEGFDWYEFKESLEKNIEEGKPARGASTISQQLVKNLFLSTSKTPMRKIKEWILTWKLEQVISKPRILELYLNCIEWGDGIYGIQAASLYHFGKPATALSREESAQLAAVIPNPRRWRPNGTSSYIQRRAEMILRRMEARGI